MRKFKKVYVEITNVCNLNCSFCPKTKRLKRFMSVDEFTQVASIISPLTTSVCLHLMGEPLLHPNIKQILKVCKSYNLGVYLTTNGTLLNKNIKLLKEGYCKLISISLHSYEANNSNLTLDEYLNSVFTACDEIVKNSDTFIQFRLWNESEEMFAKNRLNNQIINKVNRFFNKDIKLSLGVKKYAINDRMFVEFDNVFEWPINTKREQKTCTKFCYGLRSHFGVLCDGTVVACCLDNDGNLNLGNIFKTDINQILSSQRAMNIYNGFTNRNVTEEFCKTCTYANRFLGKKS